MNATVPRYARLFALGALSLSLMPYGHAASNPADAIYFGGKIITVNDLQPEAEAVAIKGGKIVAVGYRDEVMKLKGKKTTLVDLAGKTMLPGFIDPHGHVFNTGIQAISANLLPRPDGDVIDFAIMGMMAKRVSFSSGAWSSQARVSWRSGIIGAASLSAVSSKAGLSTRPVYYRFADKDELACAVWNGLCGAELLSALARVVRAVGDGPASRQELPRCHGPARTDVDRLRPRGG